MARTISVPVDGRAGARVAKPLLALRGDDHLVELVRRGNEAAFEVIYERHVAGILSFCRHMLGSREEGEDAVQHAFAAAHRDLLRDQREIRLKPWLYAIARNRCLSILRARREQPDDALERSTAGLDEEVERRADLRELLADLEDLPEDQRAALVLSELGDLSHADVAAALGCQVAHVKGLVFRARAGLIERREARSAACEEIQQELASARGGALRRGRLRHHLRACAACSGYLEHVRSQRKMIALILPVVPSVGLKKGVLAAVGIGGGASGGGGAAAGGGLLAAALPASGATVAKVAVVGVLVGGAGVAGQAAIDRDAPPPSSAPAPEAAADSPRSALRRSEHARASDERGRASDEPGSVGERRVRAPGATLERQKRDEKAPEEAPAHARRQDLAPGAGVPLIDEPKPQQVTAPERVGDRVPNRVQAPEPPSLPAPPDPPELPNAPVEANLPQPPSLPVHAEPPAVPACGLSNRLCD